MKVPELPPSLAYDAWAATYPDHPVVGSADENPFLAAAARALFAVLSRRVQGAAIHHPAEPSTGYATSAARNALTVPFNARPRPPKPSGMERVGEERDGTLGRDARIAASFVQGRDALDVACGPGRWLAWLSGAGARSVAGVDLSLRMATRARATSDAVAVGDMRALPFADRSCDLILHVLALSHVADPAPVLAECARLLRPGGVLALVDLHPNFADLGWQRTFRDQAGRLRAVRWWPQTPEHIAGLAECVGLDVAQDATGTLWHPEVLGQPDLAPGATLPDGLESLPIIYALAATRPNAPGVEKE